MTKECTVKDAIEAMMTEIARELNAVMFADAHYGLDCTPLIVKEVARNLKDIFNDHGTYASKTDDDVDAVRKLTEALKAGGYSVAPAGAGPGIPVVLPPVPKVVSGKKAVLYLHGKPLPVFESDVFEMEYTTFDDKPLKQWKKTKAKDADFPHECPKCKGPAYIGFSKIECKAKCK